LIGNNKRAVRERSQRRLSSLPIEPGHFSDVLNLCRQSEIRKSDEDSRFFVGEFICKVTEDKLQRIVFRRATAEKLQRIGNRAAASTTKLTSSPAQQQWITVGLLVQIKALGATGFRY